MQKKSPLDSASVSRRALVVLLICAAACLLVTRALPAFLRSEAPANLPQRTLSFAERVAYQHAIEDVYWRHRIWPKERPYPKPLLDAVMSQAQLEKKVEDYLRKSQALEDYWQRPITGEQLQAEMDRIAKHTKQPEVLHELFAALGNDPFVIAECLARPALAERLLTSWYAYDQRIHSDLKQSAEADLQAHPNVEQMKQLSGKDTEIEFVRSDGVHEEANNRAGQAVKLNSREWDEIVQKLAAAFGVRRDLAAFQSADMSAHSQNAGAQPYETIPVGKLSPLQEDDSRYYATAVIEKTDDHLKLATIAWLKEPLASWLARAEHQAPTGIIAPGTGYVLPKFDGTGCIDDTWTATSGPPDGRYGHTAVWTGAELIVWGGFKSTQTMGFNTGGRYNPSTDIWTNTNTSNAPTARYNHTAVWTGNQMVVWGGSQFNVNYFNTGGMYDPNTDSWTATTTGNAPIARANHTVVWTGSRMIVWGGITTSGYVNTGGTYDPNTDTWTATSTTSAPSARRYHTAVWSGSEMIIWGGYNGAYLNTGGRYNPNTDSWATTSPTNAPDPRQDHTAVWTGTEMISWGGNAFNTGARYNPATNSWTATSTTNAPDGRSLHTAVWTGSEMIVWGGLGASDLNTGGRYNPNTNSWTATVPIGAPTARARHTAIWSGNEMIVWGGTGATNFYAYSNEGGKYDPSTDSWTPTGKTPTRRRYHVAVWTGSEMIIWGGFSQFDAGTQWNTGATYNPGTDTWVPTTVTNAPSARDSAAAVWAGTEMIVWGGYNFNDGFLNTGGKYNPSTDNWTVTSTINAPSSRFGHSAVWNGSEMIVWGGAGDTGYLNTGGRYNSSADVWTATTTDNAPEGRTVRSGVWTGSEMIVWGGYFFDGKYHYLNTGGRYNPNL